MKVLASDFDGTLFFHDKGFKEEDIEKIKEFQQKGHLFGICSGRSLKGIQVQIDPRIQLDFYIISSGAQILDKDLNMISQHIIDKNVVIKIISFIHEKMAIDIEGVHHRFSLNRDHPRIDDDILLSSIEELKEDVISFSLHLSSEKEAKKYTDWLNGFKDIHEFKNKKDIDITKTGISKGTGIQEIKKYYHIEDHCFAGIGDALNDLPMLQSVDIPYTFEDSSDDVKKYSKYIVSSVAKCLEHLESL